MTRGRVKRRAAEAVLAGEPAAAPLPEPCVLCGRPLGTKVEWHHAVPKSQGGRETVPVHPICHRAIHAAVPNADLAKLEGSADAVRAIPAVARFVRWVQDKPPDFHAPTRRGQG